MTITDRTRWKVNFAWSRSAQARSISVSIAASELGNLFGTKIGLKNEEKLFAASYFDRFFVIADAANFNRRAYRKCPDLAQASPARF